MTEKDQQMVKKSCTSEAHLIHSLVHLNDWDEIWEVLMKSKDLIFLHFFWNLSLITTVTSSKLLKLSEPLLFHQENENKNNTASTVISIKWVM